MWVSSQRININNINIIDICNYLKYYKDKFFISNNDIDDVMKYNNYVFRWYMIDEMSYLPSISEWYILKKILSFDEKYDRMVTEYINVNDIDRHIRDENLSKVILKPKHRYVLFLGSKKEKKELICNLLLFVYKYPKGKSDKYDCIDIVNKQSLLMNYCL